MSEAGPELGTVSEWCAKANIDPATILGWYIWYADGTFFSSRGSEIDDLPASGVQVARIFHLRPESDTPKTIYSYLMIGCDPYWLPGATNPKEGTWVSQEEHDKFTDLSIAARWEDGL